MNEVGQAGTTHKQTVVRTAVLSQGARCCKKPHAKRPCPGLMEAEAYAAIHLYGTPVRPTCSSENVT